MPQSLLYIYKPFLFFSLSISISLWVAKIEKSCRFLTARQSPDCVVSFCEIIILALPRIKLMIKHLRSETEVAFH